MIQEGTQEKSPVNTDGVQSSAEWQMEVSQSSA